MRHLRGTCNTSRPQNSRIFYPPQLPLLRNNKIRKYSTLHYSLAATKYEKSPLSTLPLTTTKPENTSPSTSGPSQPQHLLILHQPFPLATTTSENTSPTSLAITATQNLKTLHPCFPPRSNHLSNHKIWKYSTYHYGHLAATKFENTKTTSPLSITRSEITSPTTPASRSHNSFPPTTPTKFEIVHPLLPSCSHEASNYYTQYPHPSAHTKSKCAPITTPFTTTTSEKAPPKCYENSH